MRESSLSRSRTFSPRKKKKLKVPGFLRMKGKHHYRRRKHKVAIQTGATLQERGGAVCKNKPTDALCSRESQESGSPIIHSVTPPGKHLEEQTISRPGTASAFTPVTRHRKKAEAGMPKESASPRGPTSVVSEAAGRDSTTTLSPPLPPMPASTPLRSPGTSWTSIITRDTSGRTTPRTAAILTMLRRAARDVPSPATVGNDGRPPKCLDRVSTVSEIRWACDDDEPLPMPHVRYSPNRVPLPWRRVPV
ncbi:hypothetical protein HPB51_014897 [Rhipicephalus microplus]|uniref:Uncharacterized protein n=1 Tax=Rhipicephalus microplus TaxID=6941 RepID=A0A9J6ET82_RHIMP|nr:hypothetical protein HPB51_014897 [Rhipicephalus microplus]